jgi:lysophospholipase L1-like esterase
MDPLKPHSIQLNPGTTILFEGDSITGMRHAGTNDNWPWLRLSGAASGYGDRVGEWIFCNRPDLRIECRLGAVGGSSMEDVISRWKLVEDLKPALVVMTVGSNDPWKDVPLETFRKQVADYAQRLDELCLGKILYLSNPTCSFAVSEARERRARATDYYRAAAEEVVQAGGMAVDLGATLERKAKWLYDLYPQHTIYHDGGAHFNAVGNEIIATVVLRMLGLVELPNDVDPLVFL